LERLQKHFSPLISSLILAPIWWAWHLPLFFIQGTRQSGWDLGSPEFWFFTAGIFPLSILLTWIYNCNKRSILAAVLLHFTYNFTMSLVLPLSRSANLFHLVILFAAAVGVAVFCEQGCYSNDPE
jgi:membrane protease YdiL (CAAX protease family)